METTIKEVSPVEYELEIQATAEEIAPELDKALRTQRAQTQMKGFRPGKVPTSLVKKMYGQALAFGIAEKMVQDTYEAQVRDTDTYDVIGQPMLTRLDYEMDGDLQATIRFGVRPTFELQELDGETVPKLVHTVTEEDVDKELEQIRRREADLVPVEGEGAGPEDQVVIDMQQLDEASGTPLVGTTDEDVTFFLDDEDKMEAEVREALVGKQAGETVRVDVQHGHGDHVHTHAYQVTLKEVKRRELPEVDDAFVQEVTEGRFETLETFRADLKERIEQVWQRQSREMLEAELVERVLELNPLPIPAPAVEMYLDSFVADVRQRNGGSLPKDFNEAAFRRRNRAGAEQQAHWMLVRDKLIETEGLEVTEADIDAYFEETAGDNEQLPASLLRQYYEQMNMLDRVRQEKLSEKVFNVLASRFTIEEMETEAFKEALQARRERREAEARARFEAEAEAPAEAAPAEETTAPEAEAEERPEQA